MIYCLSIVVVVVGIRAANRPVPPTSLSWTRLMYASPSHRCRGLDKNRRRRSQFMRVAPQSCHSCQLAIATRGRRVRNECVRERSRRRCSNLSRPLNLCHVHTCVASSLSVSGPFPAVPVRVPVYHLKSCSGDKKLYCHVHNLRDLHANERKRRMRKATCPVSFTSIRRERATIFDIYCF